MIPFFAGSTTLPISFRSFAHLPARVLARTTALPLLLLLTLLQSATAQQSYPQGAALDPPGSVARLNLAEGAVSFAPAEDNGNTWTPAVLNRPLTSGDRLWTGRRARSELHVGSTAVRMSEQTSLDFLALDDNLTQLRLAQGSAQLRVRTLFEGQRLEVDTPNLAFVISEPGDYRLDVNPDSDITRVVALSGGGVLYGDNGAVLNLGSQQQGSFGGRQLTPAAPGAAVQDSFDAWAAVRDRREDQSVSARYVPRETIGYQQLDSYGDWQQDPGYGAVWLPRAVPVNWAPYRVGHWSWIAPWGWTWVDDAPWGFAPFHYGRWAQIGPRWAWVPGRLPTRPVYAPALVAFVGGSSGGVNWNISIGAGSAPSPGVGWFPLAPGEAFRPAYFASPRYITQVNNNIVVNNTVNISNNYRYQRQPAAVTAVSRDTFVRGRPMQGNLHALSAADLGQAQVLIERGAMPQRPDVRERPSLVPAAALPPAAVALQPVVHSPVEHGDKKLGVADQNNPRAARPDSNDRTRRTQAVPAMPPPASSAATAPAVRPSTVSAPERSTVETGQRNQREPQPQPQQQQQQLQRDQARQQTDSTRQQETQVRQDATPQPQRALRDPTRGTGSAAPLVSPDALSAAERSSINQTQQARQQLQRDQQRQQAEQGRQQERQRRQAEEAQGQRDRREQAQKQQEQTHQQDAQRRQLEAQQARQQLQRDQQRQQAEQGHQQQQQQQQDSRKPQAQERHKTPLPDTVNGRVARPEGEAIRHREP